MHLLSIKYSEFTGQSKGWYLDQFNLGPVNLVVGKNATGKSRALSIMANLAKLIRGDIKELFVSSNYDVILEHEGNKYQYILEISNGVVISENLMNLEQQKCLITRGKDGTGKIYANLVSKGEDIDFQIAEFELAVTKKRDKLQHPYLELLYQWADNLYFYQFGTALGRNILLAQKEVYDHKKNADFVVSALKSGLEEHKEKFKNQIINDMESLDYHIDNIGVGIPSNIHKVHGHLNPEDLIGMWITEKGIDPKIEQRLLSSGMFRALSLIIQLNYSLLTLTPTCIIIDDIGEGLDYERSCGLIELLLSKVKKTDIQLIMSTNDKFVMNEVPLEHWAVLTRDNSHCQIYNYKNSENIFKDFKFTGLSNFDFFSMDYLGKKAGQ